MANLTLPNLQPFLSAAADAIVPVLPPTLASLALNGTARFAAGTTPYKFASWPNRVPYLDVAAWPAWPVWVVDGWTGTIDGLISTVASYALPGVLGPAVSNWIARALVQVYVMKFFFMLVFFPMFLFYRAADRWGFMDKWKTNPHRSNPDTKAEDKIWAAFFPSVLYSVPWESLTYWLLFYSRGEIALSAVPPVSCKQDWLIL